MTTLQFLEGLERPVMFLTWVTEKEIIGLGKVVFHSMPGFPVQC